MRRTQFVTASLFAFALALPATAFAQSPAAETPAAPAAPAAPAEQPAPVAPAPVPSAPTPVPAAPAPAPAAAKLSGLAAWNAIVGNTISGKKDGDDYDYYVKADGTIVWLDDGDIETGKWALEGQNVCMTFPDEDKECYSVELDGDLVTFKDTDGSGFRGTLAKGNPKKL